MTFSASSQSGYGPPVTLYDKLQDAVDPIDDQFLQTNLFIERSPGLVNLYNHDGTLSGDTCNYAVFGQVYAMLYGAMNSPDTTLPIPENSYMQYLANMNEADPVPIGLIFRKYDRFKADAVSSGLIQFSNNTFSYTGSGQSPFEVDSVFVAAPLKAYAPSGQATFVIDEELIYTEPGVSVDSVFVNSGSGYFPVNLNTAFTLSENLTEGGYAFDIKAIFSNGNSMEASASLFNIYGDEVNREPDTVREMDAVPGEHSGFIMEFFFHCDDKKIRKPLVIINGYDPPQKEALGINQTNGVMFTFLASTPFPATEPNTTLEDYIDQNEYDLVWLTYDDGGAPLEELSEGVKLAIEDLNAYKAQRGSNHENVIVGVSHGGLVGKWALLDFEENGEDHETELFINFDEGQRGANFSLAIQHMLRHLLEMEIDGEMLRDMIPLGPEIEGLFSSRALRDLIIYSAWGNNGTESETADAYFNNIENKGLNGDSRLHNTRYLTLANGSLLGINQQRSDNSQYQPGDILLDVYAKNTALFPNRFIADFELRFLPDNPTQDFQIYSGRLSHEVWSILEFSYVTIWSDEYDWSVTNTRPLDNAPGGFMGNTSMELSISDYISDFPALIDFSIPLPEFGPFCITPLVSSVDLRDPEFQNLNFAGLDNIENIKTQGITRTHDYIGSFGDGINESANLRHPRLTVDNMPYFLSYISTANMELQNIGLLENNESFNFGLSTATYDISQPAIQTRRTGHTITEGLDLNNTSRLLFNSQGRIGFSTNNLAGNNILDQDREYYIEEGGCTGDPVIITANDQSEILINESNTLAETKLHLISSSIHLRNNSSLAAYENAEVILQEESTIGLFDDAIVYAVDDCHFLLNGKSEIQLHQNADFRAFDGSGLTIDDESSFELFDNTELIANTGSSLFLTGGSTLSMNDNAKITLSEDVPLEVADQSTLLLGSGTVLELFENAEIFVDETSEIIIEDGATIHLYDPNLADEITRLVIEGKLSLEGDLYIAGEGRIELINNFVWNQVGADCQIQSDDKLKDNVYIRDHQITISEDQKLAFIDIGLIFDQNGGIKVDNGSIKVQNSILSSPDYSNGIEAVEAFSVILEDTDFIDLGKALHVEDYSCPRPIFNALFRFDDLNFNYNKIAIHFYVLDRWVNVNNCFITGFNVPDATGIIAEYVDKLGFWGSEVFGCNDIGIDLKVCKYFNLGNSRIAQCGVGINGSEVVGSNVMLWENTIIEQNTIGIHLNGQRVLQNGQLTSTGLVHMDCASILNNGTGILGEDVLLSIDPEHNSNANNTGVIRPNNFDSYTQQTEIFDILYKDRDVKKVYATHNYWGQWTPPDGSPGVPYTILKELTPSSIVPVPVLFDNYQNSQLNDCPEIVVTPPVIQDPIDMDAVYKDPGLWGGVDPPNYYTTDNTSGDSVNVIRVFNLAYQHLMNDSIEIAEIFMDYFVSHTPYGLSKKMDHLIQVAEIFATESPLYGELRGSGNFDRELKVVVYPNPVSAQLNIESNKPISSIRCMDEKGRPIRHLKTNDRNYNYTLSTESWKDGLYIIEITLQGEDRVYRKVIKTGQ